MPVMLDIINVLQCTDLEINLQILNIYPLTVGICCFMVSMKNVVIQILRYETLFASYNSTKFGLQVNYVKRSSFDFVTHLEFSSLALQI